MRGLPDEDTQDGVSPLADVENLVIEGRYGRADLALRRLEALIPSLAPAADTETLLLALYGRALLLRQERESVQTALAACDVLERAAHERDAELWVATACATRARFRVDSGDIGGATADLARADDEAATGDLTSDTGYRLLDALALVYSGLRLHDRADEVRDRIEDSIKERRLLDQAQHWSTWSGELAARAMEPLAGGAPDPEHSLMGRAIEVAARLDSLPEDRIPSTLRRGARGVRALSAAYRGRPSEALRLLGPDAFGKIADLPLVERQVVSLAAMRAHALVGSLATARSLDDAAADSTPTTLPNLVLEVCRTRERLWLETYAGGDVIPVLHRMTELLVRLGWRGMDLIADTARQALEHQALRTESRTDALTGVGNRRALDEELRQLLRFGPLPLALILVDIDHFKGVNDVFTHVVGDEVLRRVAASLSLQLRTDDQLLRYGGDEFVVLLPGTGDEEADAVAERMRAAVAERPWNELADDLQVTITTGVAAVWSLSGRRPDADAEKLFRRADERLLEGKRSRPEMSRSHQRPALPSVLPAPAALAAAAAPSAQSADFTVDLGNGQAGSNLDAGIKNTGFKSAGFKNAGFKNTVELGNDSGNGTEREKPEGVKLPAAFNRPASTGPTSNSPASNNPAPNGSAPNSPASNGSGFNGSELTKRPAVNGPERNLDLGADEVRIAHAGRLDTTVPEDALLERDESAELPITRRPLPAAKPVTAPPPFLGVTPAAGLSLPGANDDDDEDDEDVPAASAQPYHGVTPTRSRITGRPGAPGSDRLSRAVFEPDPDDDLDETAAGLLGGRRDGRGRTNEPTDDPRHQGTSAATPMRSRREARAATRPDPEIGLDTSAGRDAAEAAAAAREVAKGQAEEARKRAAREARARDDAARDAEVRVRAEREREARDAELRDRAAREKAAREAVAREKALREAAAAERAAQEAAAREVAEAESRAKLAKEKAEQEQAAREAAESAAREAAEAAAREAEARAEQERRRAAERARVERERRLAEAREQELREAKARAEQARREAEVREQERRDAEAREQAAREKAAREKAEQEQAAREAAEAAAARKAAEEREAAEAERRREAERVRVENERRRVEQERREAEAREKQRREDEARAEQERRAAKAEQERQEAAARARAERELQERKRVEAERQAAERRERERREAEAREAEQARQEARARAEAEARAAAVERARVRAEAEAERARAADRIREEAYARAAEQARRAAGGALPAPSRPPALPDYESVNGHSGNYLPAAYDEAAAAAAASQTTQPLQRRAPLYDASRPPEPVNGEQFHERRSHPRPGSPPRNGAGPNPQNPNQQNPNQYPQNYGQNGADPLGQGSNGAAPGGYNSGYNGNGYNGNGYNSNGYTGAGPNGAAAIGPGPGSHNPSSHNPNGAGPHGAAAGGPPAIGAGPNVTGPNATGPNRTGPNGTGPDVEPAADPDSMDATAIRTRREPFGPVTRSQAIIDLSARKRPRSPYSG